MFALDSAPSERRAYNLCYRITGSPDAWRLLDDFDRLIETLWGKRKFRVLEMPGK
mgnify:CR=1 FL=1